MKQSIILLRHAESHHNHIKEQIKSKNKGKRVKDTKQYQQIRFSKILQDNGLTNYGLLQCQKFRQKFNWSQIGIVLVSPSRRCLQTAYNIFINHKDISIKIEPLLFSRITNAWSLGSPKQFLEKQFPQFNFSKLDETQKPWYSQILTLEMQKYFIDEKQALKALESGAIQSYFDFQSRSKKIWQLIDLNLTKLPENKKLMIISHSKVLKLLTATGFQQNGKSISKQQFENCVPYEFTRQELFEYCLPTAKI